MGLRAPRRQTASARDGQGSLPMPMSLRCKLSAEVQERGRRSRFCSRILRANVPGCERFRRRMQLVEVCATTNKPNVAQPFSTIYRGRHRESQTGRMEDSRLHRQRSGNADEDERQDPGGQGRATKAVREDLPARSARKRWETQNNSCPGEMLPDSVTLSVLDCLIDRNRKTSLRDFAFPRSIAS